MSASNEDSESVDQFLARIASLKDRRDREDEERTRKLEEDILQGRRERQARRAERARSLSPTKSSPAPSVSSLGESNTFATRNINPPSDFNLRAPTLTPSKLTHVEPRTPSEKSQQLSPEANRPLPTAPTMSKPAFSPGSGTGLARSGTLSWQQRPSSRDSNSSRPRPMSMAPMLSATNSPGDSIKSKSTEDLSRSEIAKSLGSKDPAWFKQTSDRGLGSAAFRRSQVESDSEPVSRSGSLRLPGLSRESTPDPGRVFNSQASSPPSNSMGAAWRSQRLGDSSPPKHENALTRPLSKSLVLEPTAKKSPELQDASEVETQTMDSNSRAGATFSMDRPPSPTKGLGGFVQSAMMKRSDSVNKRWSVQASTGLKRGDSVATNPNARAGMADSNRSPTRESRYLRAQSPSSPLANSRPSSSHGSNTFSSNPDHVKTSESPKISSRTEEKPLADLNPIKPPIKPRHLDMKVDTIQKPVADETLPVSPTKTLDSRRWSPTKASWLESALSKPESTKLAPQKPEQPSWKADLQKSKFAKATAGDAPSPPPSFAVPTTTGLLRSPPPGGSTKPLSVGGLPEGFSSGMVKKGVQAPPTKPAHLSREIADREVANASTAPDKTDLPKSSDNKIIKEPPTIKAKPQTPPKTDFRANLKTRQAASGDNNGAEPEFKAVFGKLKRAQTQNYVAPDELKDNITRGKAGLSVTDGPQKTKRVDEFKESIMQKKEEMKTSGGSISKRGEDSKSPAVPEKPTSLVPEALARRQTLKKPQAMPKPGLTTSTNPTEKTVVSQKLGGARSVVEEPDTYEQASRSLPDLFQETSVQLKPESNHNAHLRSATLPNRAAGSVQPVTAEREEAAEISKLAARLNPSLASILTRSSSPKLVSRGELSSDLPLRPPPATRKVVESEGEGSGASLNHMTKARAKGPKRRLPKTDSSAATSNTKTAHEGFLSTDSKEASRSSLNSRPENEGVSRGQQQKSTQSELNQSSHSVSSNTQRWPPVSSTPTKMIDFKSVTEGNISKQDSLVTKPKSKPAVAAKSPELRKVSSPTLRNVSREITSVSKLPAVQTFDIATDEASSVKSKGDVKIEESSLMPSSATSNSMPLTPSKTKLNSFGAARIQQDTPQKSPAPKTTPRVQGLGLNFEPTEAANPQTAGEPTPPPEKDFGIAKRRWGSPAEQIVSSEKSEPRRKRETSKTSDAPRFLGDFFDQMPKASQKGEFDTQTVLSASNEGTEKIKTLKMQIWEITGDGKRIDMPPQQEHILYEECMYLCTHTFHNTAGSKSAEVYLWCGDAVAEAAVEDAQIFCKRLARDNNAKLDVLKQGKETSHFFQALGGIVITKRSKSSSLYMLCGRRHQGHVAFDEVDLDSSSLCSGFPYIVSAKFGKLFLWKGRGSGADELGCARLIAMDMGLTGEMEEVDEGKEPPSFFESFPSTTINKRQPSTEYWQSKSGHDAYGTRLYRVEHDRPKSSAGFWGRRGSSPAKASNKGLVEELRPYSQKDLDPSHIYVLDAYYEIYVFTGADAQSKPAEFVTASLLAHEISILTPSLQDRPIMPVCRAIFGEPPADFKLSFRKWQMPRTQSPTSSTILPLNDVIEALG